MDGDPAPEIGQAESRSSIAAVEGSDQREERRILADGQELSVTEGPSAWREVASEHDDLCNEWF